ncbi:MAG: YceI family protein [Deltaproteobacteria bacterium]|nr:YceI family protein [Deltaproteobacteria bacterium]
MLRLTHTLIMACALAGLATVPACDKGGDAKADGKKADAKKADAKKTDAKKADAKADDKKADDKKADDKKADAPPTGDALVIKASHTEPKPDDPVTVTVTGVRVVKATFDPKNVEGGTAEIEIDPGTLTSGSDMRDNHLKSPDYLDLPQFPKITVAVSDVKKAGDGYTAKLVVKGVGKEVTWEAVPFAVLETTDTGVKIKLDHEFKRDDFGLGKPEGDNVAQKLEASLTMMINKTG